MTDLALLDQITDIIRRVPHAHNQGAYIARNHEKEAAEAELAANPDLAAVVNCNITLCVAGWALHLKGYPDFGCYTFTRPAGHHRAETHVLSVEREAARVLGLSPEEAGEGIFLGSNTLADIEDWVAYYRGELGREQLHAQLELRAAER